MKVLVTTHPVAAQFETMIFVARALVRAGHDVAVACASSFRPVVERSGFPSFSAGLDWTDATVDRVFPDAAKLSEADRRMWFMTGVFAGTAAYRMVPDLLTIAAAWRPAMIVRSDCEFASVVAAERLGLPLATVGVDLGIPPVYLKRLIERPFWYMRRSYHLPPDPDCLTPRSNLYLSLLPPDGQLPEFAGERSVRYIRPCDELVPATARRNSALVCVSPHMADRVASELQSSSYEVVVGSSESWRGGEALVTDGRFADVVQALTAGLPMLICPGRSRPFHTARWEALGVARIEPRESATPARLREHVRALLDSPRYRARAADIRHQSCTLPGPAQAVAWLEALAA